MKMSVLIPVYNAAATIRATIESALRQTAPADEILVMDDGSTDQTVSILDSFKPRITVFRQPNRGVASARNALCARATGDLIAFLDSDDLWHPTYLEVQRKLFETYPCAVAFFTGHVDFPGYGTYQWASSPVCLVERAELIEPLTFCKRYNEKTGSFASMSYCCIPKKVLTEVGHDPFPVSVSGADDFFLFNLLPLLGPVAYVATLAVAYRVTDQAQSANVLRALAWSIRSFELLEKRFEETAETRLLRTFRRAFSSQRRGYAKRLMGVGEIASARAQLRQSLKNSGSFVSFTKSIIMSMLTFMPASLQPTWPSDKRVFKGCDT